MSERWLPVVGYEGLYEVSDEGRVRSVDRFVEHPNMLGPGRIRGPRKVFRRGTLLALSKSNGAGHRCVGLSRDGVATGKLVHRLVLEAFVGPCPDGQQCLHANDIGDDNRLSNLRWGTPKENAADAVTNGRRPGKRSA